MVGGVLLFTPAQPELGHAAAAWPTSHPMLPGHSTHINPFLPQPFSLCLAWKAVGGTIPGATWWQ
jgi:hypothetical protein